jgi:hypothetical protein
MIDLKQNAIALRNETCPVHNELTWHPCYALQGTVK